MTYTIKNFKFLNRLTLPVIIGMFAILSSFSQQRPHEVEWPRINGSNSSTLDISKVELNDSNTVLHVNANFRPHYWIRIASDSYLMADGKKYAMTGTEGIDADKEFWMPESGHADFKLIFEPIPFSTEKFDFIEGDSKGAFRLWDVDLTGKEAERYPEGLPKSLKQKFTDGKMPDMVFESGTTTIKFHLLPYRKELADGVCMYVNSIDGRQEEYPLEFDDEGNATVIFDQYGTAQAFVINRFGISYAGLTLLPGETVDCYLDTRLSGIQAMQQREGFNSQVYSQALHNGHYVNYDRMRDQVSHYYGLNLYTGELADYRMTGEQYKEMVRSKYLSNSDSISHADLPQMEKEYHQLNLNNDVLKAIVGYRFFLEHNYRHVKQDWRTPVPEDSIVARLTDSDFAEVVGWIDTTDPRLLIISNAVGLTDWNAYGAKGDLSKSIKLFREMADKALKQQLKQEDLDSLKTLSNGFFAIACDSINQRTAREFARLRQKATVAETPDVADDKVFDAIIAPHKGKVVVVDLWNTWCGPCRAALKENEPLKSAELANDDIVWIYIADESSDPVKYLDMITEIKGIHYKLTESQKNALKKRFNVDGIPYYIIVDRQGKAEGRPDLREHSKYIETIKSKL